MDPRVLDPRGLDPRAMDPRATDPRVLDPRGLDPRAMDPYFGTHYDPFPMQMPHMPSQIPPDRFLPPLDSISSSRRGSFDSRREGESRRHSRDSRSERESYKRYSTRVESKVEKEKECDTICIQNLGNRSTERDIEEIFSHLPGFMMVSLSKRSGRQYSFVKFDTVDHATMALEAVDGFALESWTSPGTLLCEFARRSLELRPKERNKKKEERRHPFTI